MISLGCVQQNWKLPFCARESAAHGPLQNQVALFMNDIVVSPGGITKLLKESFGTWWRLPTVKNILTPTPVTDRSKAVVPVLFLFCVALRFILRGASCFKVFLCSLSSCFFISFSIVSPSLEEEGAGLCASRAFLCVHLSFYHFSLPHGVRGWLRFVTVALPGLFY